MRESETRWVCEVVHWTCSNGVREKSHEGTHRVACSEDEQHRRHSERHRSSTAPGLPPRIVTRRMQVIEEGLAIDLGLL